MVQFNDKVSQDITQILLDEEEKKERRKAIYWMLWLLVIILPFTNFLLWGINIHPPAKTVYIIWSWMSTITWMFLSGIAFRKPITMAAIAIIFGVITFFPLRKFYEIKIGEYREPIEQYSEVFINNKVLIVGVNAQWEFEYSEKIHTLKTDSLVMVYPLDYFGDVRRFDSLTYWYGNINNQQKKIRCQINRY